MTTVYLDYETRCVLDLQKVGTYRYVCDPSFKILIVNYAIGNGPVISVYAPSSDFDAFAGALMNATRLVAHNAQFEHAVTCEVLDAECLAFLPEWECTAARARRCGLPSALDGAARALQLPVQKDPRGKQLIRKISRRRKHGVRSRNRLERFQAPSVGMRVLRQIFCHVLAFQTTP